MEHSFRRALSRVATRVVGSRFTKPIARVALAGAGLVLLAFVGRTAALGAITNAAGTAPGPSASTPVEPPSADHAASPTPDDARHPPAAPEPSTVAAQHPSPRATTDDPVVLNTATDTDLRRLPGVGAKRADAILALRARLGRFRAAEDLLKVKGIGRATLKRLRPLMRLDPIPSPDAGAARPASAVK